MELNGSLNFPCDEAQTDNCLFSRTHTTEVVSNLESQVFKAENLNVSNGLLTISVLKDFPTWKGAQRNFSSGIIYSNKIFQFQRGKFEIKCKLPNGAGLWPQFWLFGGGTEIDIFEFRRGSTTKQEMSFHHYNGSAPTDDYALTNTSNSIDYSQDFHTFAVEWDLNQVRWLVDGQPKNTVQRLYQTIAGQTTSSCNLPAGIYNQYNFYPRNPSDPVAVIAGIGTEGTLDGNQPPLNGNYPKKMEIDYIRVYQRSPEQWFPPICTVKGADVICTNQNYTFTIPEDLGSLTWSTSSNLTIISQNSTSISVRSKPSVTFENAWVKADFAQQSICGTVSSTKNFWIGRPDPINVVEYINFCEACYSIDATCSPNSKASFVWSSSGGYNVPTGCSNIGPNFLIPYSVTATNVCGSQNASGTLSPPYCESGPFRTSSNITISPNPSNSTAKITLNNININDIVQVLILDRNGAVVKRIASGVSTTFDIDVSNYQNGLYNITVQRKANLSSISSQFTVQH